MTARQETLYRYLVLWADFTPAEAREYIFSARKREQGRAA